MHKLVQAIRHKQAKLVVVGLGYVGLPVACMFARAGFAVTGIRRSADKVALINRGVSPIEGDEPGLPELLAEVVNSGLFRATTEYQACREADVALVAVETPVDTETHQPDYVALRGALVDLGRNMEPGMLVIIESTIAPQTMETMVRPVLEETSGLRVNEGFYLAHCPERVMPGKLLANIENCARVVGGMNPDTAQVAVELYGHIVRGDLDATDCLTAELVKTAENAYRDVQIAFANEVALLCESVGADVWQVRSLINKSPFRDMHLPGAGVGGHCIPKDPWLLVHGAGPGFEPRLIPTARTVNDGMPHHVADLVEAGLREAGFVVSAGQENNRRAQPNGQAVQGARVAVLGYAYLENSDDTRNSPSAPLVQRLRQWGAEVTIHDPFVPEYRDDLRQAVSGRDCIVIMVAHDQYRQLSLSDLRNWLARPVLIDGRHVFDKESAQQAGFVYKGVGNV